MSQHQTACALEVLKIPLLQPKKWTTFVLRDDWNHLKGHPAVNGNKFRKLFFLNDEGNRGIYQVESHGSIQSNAMFSIASICFKNGWKFKYHIDRSMDCVIGANKIGNLHHTYSLIDKGLDMEFITSPDYSNVKELFKRRALSNNYLKDGILYLREGVAQPQAEKGYIQLAQDLMHHQELQHYERVNVFLPSGTGTSALYLTKNLDKRFKVFTTNCVGDESFLVAQFKELEQNVLFYPTILQTTRKYHYGKLYREMYEIINRVESECGIKFEYLYDAKGLLSIVENVHLFEDNAPLIYVHSGGEIGSKSMAERYKQYLRIG